MGKFSGSLEKAGFDAGFNEAGLSKVTAKREVAQEAPLQPAPSEHMPKKRPITLDSKPNTSRPQPKSDHQPPDLHNRHGAWDKRLFKAVYEDIHIPEIFKVIRSRIINPGDGVKVPQTILITSVVPKEGKSFVTANLGVSLAQGMDQHCLMVDCDLRRPSLANLFGMNQSAGLTDYLRDQTPLSSLIMKTDINKLSLLPSGTPPVNPAELLSSVRMQTLIEELSKRYQDRIILLDSPPMLVAAETATLASQVDAVLLVVRQGKGSKSQLQTVVENIGAQRVLGVVFNDYTTNLLESRMAGGYGYYQGNYSRA